MKVQILNRIRDPINLYREQWVLYPIRLKLTLKYSAWGHRSLDLNLTELAGICLNGGICGLMRWSTHNLTNVTVLRLLASLYFEQFRRRIEGVAWLSSVRALKCRINFLLRTQPSHLVWKFINYIILILLYSFFLMLREIKLIGSFDQLI